VLLSYRHQICAWDRKWSHQVQILASFRWSLPNSQRCRSWIESPNRFGQNKEAASNISSWGTTSRIPTRIYRYKKLSHSNKNLLRITICHSYTQSNYTSLSRLLCGLIPSALIPSNRRSSTFQALPKPKCPNVDVPYLCQQSDLTKRSQNQRYRWIATASLGLPVRACK